MSFEDTDSDSEFPNHPYEPSRLADPRQQDELSRILGIASESVTNVHPVKEPQRLGTGGVRRFASNRSATLPHPPHSENAGSASGHAEAEDHSIDLTVLPPGRSSTTPELGGAGEGDVNGAVVEPTREDTTASSQADNVVAPVPIAPEQPSAQAQSPSQGQDLGPASSTVGIDEATPSPSQSPMETNLPAPLRTEAVQSSTTALVPVQAPTTPQRNAQACGNTVAPSGQPETTQPEGLQPTAPQPDPLLRNMTSGYASLSGFMSSDRVFTVFRRFDTLSVRSLLYLQDELSHLESRLNAVDQADRNQGTPAALWRLHSRRDDDNAERIALMAEIREKLKEYREQLLQHSKLLSLGKAKAHYIDSVSNWIDGMKPVIDEESHFLDDTADIAPLFTDHRDKGIDRFIGRKLSSLFSTKKHRARPHAQERPEVMYYSTTTVNVAVRAFITLFAAVIMVGPIFALNYVQKTVYQLVLVVVFTFILALTLSVLTQVQNHEVFEIMAAYCAVMVVFVGASQSI